MSRTPPSPRSQACRGLACLALLLVLTTGALASGAQERAPESAWHTMKVWRGVYPFVEVTTEGQRGWALLDTGASLTVIDEEYAEAAGLETRGRVSIRGTGGRARGRRASGVALSVCGRRVSNLSPVVLDLQDIADRFGHPLDAIIGGDVFKKVLLDLDYPNERAALHLPDERPRLPELGTRALPLEAVGKTRRSATLTLGTYGLVRLLVDTGAGGAVSLYPRAAQRLGLPSEELPTTTRLGGGVGGDRRQWLTLIDGVEFAGETLGRVEVRIPQKRRGKHETSGLLGGGILARYRVFYDLAGDQMTLIETGEPPAPLRDRLGLQAEWRRDALRVLHVSEGSPAERAGWRTGERIVAIEGVRPSASTWRELLDEALSRPAGEQIELVPGRGEARRSVLLDLADWARSP